MSKLCEGVKLTPVKMTTLLNKSVPEPPVPQAGYVPPHKRAWGSSAASTEKPPTAVDLKSNEEFPTLSPMKPATSGASWGQLRTRLTTPPASTNLPPSSSLSTPTEKTLKERLQESIEKDALNLEKTTSYDEKTDPFEIPANLLEKHGWIQLPIPSTSQEDLPEKFILTDEDFWNAYTEWERMGLSSDPNAEECVHIGGYPIERAPKDEPDWFSRIESPDDEYGNSTALSEERLQRARNRMIQFVTSKKKLQNPQ